MKSSREEVPVVLDVPAIKMRTVSWGDMTIETSDVMETVDPGPLFKGLPDDRCQCPHWGYVIKGALHYNFADHEEVYRAGEVYYAAPGHLPVLDAGTQYVEFSPNDALGKTMEVVERNMQAGVGLG